jgi:hypothetical protein
MDKPPPGEPPEIADASLLFGDDESAQRARRKPEAAPGGAAAGGYDLEEAETQAPKRRLAPEPPLDVERPRQAVESWEKPKREALISHSEREDDAVSKTWSRWGEWGPDLLVLGAGIVAYFAIAYFSFSLDFLGPWFLLLIFGLLALLALSYPILITLERPVRITPEQALNDYLGSLNHFRPHFRRMWLLLSDEGKTQFDGPADLKSYWSGKLSEWKAKAEGGPVTISLDDFKTEGKSAGVARITGEGSIRVSSKTGAVVFQTRVKMNFVRASDRMWYLDQGRIAG